jgi:hypothetical protein
LFLQSFQFITTTERTEITEKRLYSTPLLTSVISVLTLGFFEKHDLQDAFSGRINTSELLHSPQRKEGVATVSYFVLQEK